VVDGKVGECFVGADADADADAEADADADSVDRRSIGRLARAEPTQNRNGSFRSCLLDSDVFAFAFLTGSGSNERGLFLLLGVPQGLALPALLAVRLSFLLDRGGRRRWSPTGNPAGSLGCRQDGGIGGIAIAGACGGGDRGAGRGGCIRGCIRFGNIAAVLDGGNHGGGLGRRAGGSGGGK